MPNKRSSDKRILNLWISIETYYAFRKFAEGQGKSMTELLTTFIDSSIRQVTLTSEEYEKILREEQDRAGRVERKAKIPLKV